MKRFVMTIALTGVLSIQTLAGQIPTGGIVAPPPPPDEIQTSPGDIPTAGLAGEIPTAGFAQQAEDTLLGGFLAIVCWLT